MSVVIKGRSYDFKILFPGLTPGDTPGQGILISGETEWYQCSTTVPVSAPVSTSEAEWYITWSYNTVSKAVYFEVRDPNLMDDERYQRELSKLSITGRDYTARLVVEEQVASASLYLMRNDTEIYSDLTGVTITPHRLGYELSTGITGSYLTAGEFLLLWETSGNTYFQNLTIAPMKFIPIIVQIRFFIDRIYKQLDEPQNYTDADIYTALLGGMGIINGWHPLTEWAVVNFPNSLKPFLVKAGAWYALNSQFVLEGDMAFSYSGQTITLDYDRTGLISEEIGRLWDYLSEHLMKAKTQVIKSPGVLGITEDKLSTSSRIRIRRNFRGMRAY
jgi:hypothetical protein